MLVAVLGCVVGGATSGFLSTRIAVLYSKDRDRINAGYGKWEYKGPTLCSSSSSSRRKGGC